MSEVNKYGKGIFLKPFTKRLCVILNLNLTLLVQQMQIVKVNNFGYDSVVDVYQCSISNVT